LDSINESIECLWEYSKKCGQFQEIFLPIIGHGIDMVQISRKE